MERRRLAKEFSVLIDTWWNVNSLALISAQIDFIVLIDTWWNVNSGKMKDSWKYDRF